MTDCVPQEEAHAGEGEECEESSPEEEGVSGITYDELTTTPFPIPLHYSRGDCGEIRE